MSKTKTKPTPAPAAYDPAAEPVDTPLAGPTGDNAPRGESTLEISAAALDMLDAAQQANAAGHAAIEKLAAQKLSAEKQAAPPLAERLAQHPPELAAAFARLLDHVEAIATHTAPPSPTARVPQRIADTGRSLTRRQAETLQRIETHALAYRFEVEARSGSTIPCHKRAHVPRWLLEQFADLIEAVDGDTPTA